MVERIARPAGPRSSRTALLVWLGRGGWAIADQAFFSLTNFLVFVLLARALPAEQLGAFTIGYSIYLLVGTVHTGLIIEPMLVFGADRYRDHLPGYLRAVFRQHWRLCAIASAASACLGFAAVMAGYGYVGHTVLAFSAATPVLLFAQLVRRALYLRSSVRTAALGGLVQLAATTLALILIGRIVTLDHRVAVALLAFGAVVSIIAMLPWLGLSPKARQAPDAASEIVEVHWGYGRWAVPTGLLAWIPLNLNYLVLPFAGGTEASALLRALLNLVLPWLQTKTALTPILQIAVSTTRRTGEYRLVLALGLVAFLAASLLYGIALGVFYPYLSQWLYAGRYGELQFEVWLMLLYIVPASLNAALAAGLRAFEQADRIFLAYLASGLLALGVGVPLALLWGVAGAIVALMASNIASSLTMGICLARTLQGQPK